MQKFLQMQKKSPREPPACLNQTDPILITQKNVFTRQDAKISPDTEKKLREHLACLNQTDPILSTQKNVLTNQDAKNFPDKGKKTARASSLFR